MAVPFSHAVSGFGCTPRGLRFIADFWLEEEREREREQVEQKKTFHLKQINIHNTVILNLRLDKTVQVHNKRVTIWTVISGNICVC